MSRASRAWLTDSRPDPELAWMVVVSVVVHVVAAVMLLVLPRGLLASSPPPIVAYTVEIVDPSALGGRLPKGPIEPEKKPSGTAAAPKPEPKEPEPPAPEPKPEPKKAEPEPPPEPEEENVVTIPEKKPEEKKPEEKKPEEKKPEPKPEKKPEPKPEKKVEKKPAPAKKPEPKKPSAAEIARAERDRKIQQAIARVGERGNGKQASGLEGREEGKGAVLGTGGDGGGGGTLMGLDFIVYKNRVEGIFKRNWTWVGADPDLTVRIGFRIQEDGEIRDVRILQRSGDGSYDESVMRAIRASSPLPAPPESYRSTFADYILDFVSGDMRAGG